jgi:hypothetical protein
MLQHVPVSTGDGLHGSQASRHAGAGWGPFDDYPHMTEEGSKKKKPVRKGRAPEFLAQLSAA